MKGMIAWTVVVVGLILLPGAALADDRESVEEESAGRYGCGEPVKGSGEEVVRPKRTRYSRTYLSASELEAWGPIKVTGKIGCDGRVHDLEIDKELPEKLEAKLRKKIGKSRYEPATLAGEPVAVNYNLILNRPTRANS